MTSSRNRSSLIKSWFLGLLLCLCLVSGGRPEQRTEVYPMGSQLELFVDRRLIDRMDNLSLRLHSPKPAEIAIACDQPWEGPYTGYVVVLKDDGVFRMYYPSDRGEANEPSLVPMAESKNGINWTRPILNLIEYKGSKRNNLVMAADHASNFAPFLDSNPKIPSHQRYKAFVGDTQAIFAFTSPDGIHWSKLNEKPVLTRPPFDSQNVAFWDSHSKQYVAYMRGSMRPGGTEVTAPPWFEDFRGIARHPLQHFQRLHSLDSSRAHPV
jgi:hypothetical protein